MVLHPGPLLPAAATTKIPDASAFSTTVWRVLAAHPSLGGQVQLLFATCGRFAGSAFWPFRLVGAIRNWKHSAYVCGVPVPWSMFRQAIHFAPGATPI